MTPAEAKARLASVVAFARALFGEAGHVTVTIGVHDAREETSDVFVEAGGHVTVYRKPHAHDSYESVHINHDDPNCYVTAFRPIADVVQNVVQEFTRG